MIKEIVIKDNNFPFNWSEESKYKNIYYIIIFSYYIFKKLFLSIKNEVISFCSFINSLI